MRVRLLVEIAKNVGWRQLVPLGELYYPRGQLVGLDPNQGVFGQSNKKFFYIYIQNCKLKGFFAKFYIKGIY